MSRAISERPALKAANGHFLEKSGGSTLYQRPMDNLPLPTSISTAEAIAQMYTSGYVIFPGVLDQNEVTALRAIMDEKGGPDDAKWIVKDWCYNRHQVTDFWQDPRLLAYIDRPGIIDVVHGIHDPGAHVTGGSFWTTGSGRQMGIHLDYLPVSLPQSVHENPAIRVPIFTSTAHFYLNDMTSELGPTTVIPGSHMAGRPPFDESTWQGITPKAAMVRAGDVLLFRGDLWHGSGMNSSETDRRYMMQIHYANSSIAKAYPAMRYAELWNPCVMEEATPEQRRLLGSRD